MWLILAVVIWVAIMYYWIAILLTICSWIWALCDLIQGRFIRASIWFSIGSGMMFWWFSSDPEMDIDFWDWVQGSATIIGIVSALVLWRWYRKRQREQVVFAHETVQSTGREIVLVERNGVYVPSRNEW